MRMGVCHWSSEGAKTVLSPNISAVIIMNFPWILHVLISCKDMTGNHQFKYFLSLGEIEATHTHTHTVYTN